MKKLSLAGIILIVSLCMMQVQAQQNKGKQDKKGAQVENAQNDSLGIKSGADPNKANPGKAGNSRKKGRPVVFIIGDSTVKNGKGDGSNKQWGWGNFLWQHFDTTKVSFENHALGGRSSRTFISEGLWDKVLSAVQPGDYVIIQFGHNDAGPLNTGRARASLKGNSDKDTVVIMESTQKPETIQSFGWYMRKYAKDVKKRKATPILLSHIPRNNFVTLDSTQIIRNTKGFGQWTKEAAQMEKVTYLDINDRIATKYEKMGKDSVQLMFKGDHTHTSLAGAQLNASIVAQMIKEQKKLKLAKWTKSKRK